MAKVQEKKSKVVVGVFTLNRFYTQTRQRMKIHKPVIMLLIVLSAFTGCQQEADEVTLPEPKEAFSASSNAATLLKKVTLRDGSSDNILDSGSCVTILFPVTVTVNGEDFVITSSDELKQIERMLEESEGDDDEIDLHYPITIMLSDYTSVVINDEDELEEYTDECSEGGFDDDIECIDFVYPIKLTRYNTDTQVSDVLTVQTDGQLYGLIKSLKDDDLVSFVFPVALEDNNGTRFTANNVEQLEQVIEDAEDACDEDDDNDFDDDDVDTSALEAVIQSGNWKVAYYFDDTDQTVAYSEFTFEFHEDGTVIARNGSEENVGTWAAYGDDGELELEFEFDNDNELLDEISEDWEVTMFSTTQLELQDGTDGPVLRFQKL
ncbi:MAG: hypothetical protein JNJ75_17560 [Cyclobacteriaceae bacterium]|nr:hypothetical protein [Cyclobacteriaceae bacterium]